MLRTLLVTTSLAAGLLMIDVAQPILTGNGVAEAAQRRMSFRPAARAPRAAVRAAPRMRSNFSARSKPSFRRATIHRAGPKFSGPKVPLSKKGNFQTKKGPVVNPNLLKGNVVNPNLAPTKGGPGFGLKNGPAFGKKGLVAGPGLAPKGNFLKLGNKSWPYYKGPHKLWWGGGWKTFVPLTAVGVVLVGGAYYWPDSYVSVARPYCSGVTPEGCRLNWQQVGFEGGGSEWQCVQFCARPGVPPPPQAAAMMVAPPPPANGGKCELEIFSDQKFTGTSAPSETEQPRLVDTGWKNEIASIQVKAGTWDFFTGEEFSGDNMRLPPGPYPDLGPQWTKKIGSFMCVQGG